MRSPSQGGMGQIRFRLQMAILRPGNFYLTIAPSLQHPSWKKRQINVYRSFRVKSVRKLDTESFIKILIIKEFKENNQFNCQIQNFASTFCNKNTGKQRENQRSHKGKKRNNQIFLDGKHHCMTYQTTGCSKDSPKTVCKFKINESLFTRRTQI